MALMMGPMGVDDEPFWVAMLSMTSIVVLPGNLSDDKASKDNTQCLWGGRQMVLLNGCIATAVFEKALRNNLHYATICTTQQSTNHYFFCPSSSWS
jgi:hypothetical protein